MLKKTGERLRRWCARPFGPALVLIGGIAIGLVIVGATSTALLLTGTEKFCTTACHEMSYLADEHKDTVHDVNRTGVRATCPDCHVPRVGIPLYFRKIGAVRELWGHFVTGSIDTREKFEAKRHELAVRVWTYMKATDSRECRSCHDLDKANTTEKAQSRHAKAKAEKMACIDCHFAIAHEEPEGDLGPQDIKIN